MNSQPTRRHHGTVTFTPGRARELHNTWSAVETPATRPVWWTLPAVLIARYAAARLITRREKRPLAA